MDISILREAVSYDQDTGFFHWKASKRGRLPGANPIGTRCNGYLVIGINYRRFYAHRMAWAYVHGVWPELEIDHLNGIKTDNRIANLRQATRTTNSENKRWAMASSRSGLLGVRPSLKKWAAYIQVKKQVRYLGTFPDPESAHAAYVAAKRQLHEGCTL